MMAGLAVATGPSPEMAGIVRAEGMGLVAADFSPEAMATALDGWTPAAIDEAKHRALDAARRHHAAAQMAGLQAIYEQVLAGAAPRVAEEHA